MIKSEEQILISDMANAFAREHLRPHAARWDREKALDRSTLIAMSELGFGGIYTKEEFGGSELGRWMLFSSSSNCPKAASVTLHLFQSIIWRHG